MLAQRPGPGRLAPKKKTNGIASAMCSGRVTKVGSRPEKMSQTWKPTEASAAASSAISVQASALCSPIPSLAATTYFSASGIVTPASV
jgi:hypothetical protein